MSKEYSKPGPYGMAALAYFDAGWPDPIPASMRKVPLIKGFTGGWDYWPDRAQIETWVKQHPNTNIGLRLPKGFLALDFDMYDGRKGRQTLDRLKARFGPLPLTHISTSRRDGSGVRVYRLPDGFDGQEFADPGPGVEVIKWSHRHVMVAPSLHHRAGNPPYQWFGPVGGRLVLQTEEFPDPGDLAVLPLSWAEGLPRAGSAPMAPGDTADVRTWLSGTKGAPCSVTAVTLAGYVDRLKAAGPDGGAYSVMNNAIHALLGDAASGHRGLRRALEALRDAYLKAVAGRRTERVALGELRRSLEGDISKRTYTPMNDPCAGVPGA